MLPKSNQESTRCQSLEQDIELGYGDPYAIPVFNALHSDTPRIGKNIALLLMDNIDDKDEPVLPELIKALKDPDTDMEDTTYCRMEAFRIAS